MAKGDHLYYYLAGGSFSHHGLDCGDGTVIHYDLTPWEKLKGSYERDTSGRVARTSFDEFAQGNEVLIRSYEQSTVEVFDNQTTMGRAEQRIGDEDYSIFGNNCEHFVVWCKTGVSGSSQVEAHAKASTAVLKGAPLGLFLLKATRRVPRPYRKYATIGAVGLAGVVYVLTYMRHRVDSWQAGLS